MCCDLLAVPQNSIPVLRFRKMLKANFYSEWINFDEIVFYFTYLACKRASKIVFSLTSDYANVWCFIRKSKRRREIRALFMIITNYINLWKTKEMNRDCAYKGGGEKEKKERQWASCSVHKCREDKLIFLFYFTNQAQFVLFFFFSKKFVYLEVITKPY